MLDEPVPEDVLMRDRARVFEEFLDSESDLYNYRDDIARMIRQEQRRLIVNIDDLRDYRFYADDLVHPSPAAERYIAERFRETYFSDGLRQFVHSWQKIRQALAHRPFDETSAATRSFFEKLLRELDRLAGTVDVSREREAVENRLKNFRP